MIKLKSLTPQAEKLLKNKIEESKNKKNELILNKDDFKTKEIRKEIFINENKLFNTKFELAEYLYEELKELNNIPSGIWNFLVIIFYKQLLKNGQVGETKRFFIDEKESFYPFSHLLKPVFDLYKIYSSDSQIINFLLLGPINEGSGILLGVVKRQDLLKNRQFILVSRKIYYDEENKILKEGNTGKVGINRLITLWKQYERSYDLYSMPAEKILTELIAKHPEFNKFKKEKIIKSF